MNYENARIVKLRDYLFDVLTKILEEKTITINANMLSKNIKNYSLDKIPSASVVERWINGCVKHKDVYSFRSRRIYSTDELNNLSNIGFFEKFETIINSNNRKGVLPQIENIESIECLNTGTMAGIEQNTAIFDIQIQITYREE